MFSQEFYDAYNYYLNLIYKVAIVVLVLVISLVYIGCVIHRLWHRRRTEEIRRLVVMAAAEADRAELESSSAYYDGNVYAGSDNVTDRVSGVSDNVTDHVSGSGDYRCAVCNVPTTTRCARCKSVHYCSGKCQIMHWRQGHKEECHPSSIANQNFDNHSNSSSKAVSQDQNRPHGNSFDTEDDQLMEPVNITHEEIISSSCHVGEVLHEKDDSVKDEILSDANRTNSSNSSSSFSPGFSSSSTTSETSDDVSVSESNISDKPQQINANQASDITHDTNVPRTNLEPNQIYSKSAELDSVDTDLNSSTNPNKLNQLKPRASKHVEPSSSGLSTNESSCSIGEPLIESNSFWEGVFDYELSVNAYPSHSISRQAGASTIPRLPSQCSKHNSTVLDGTHMTDLGKNKGTNVAFLSKDMKIDARKVENLQSSSFNRSSPREDDIVPDSNSSRAKDVSRPFSASISHLSCNSGQESSSTAVLKATTIPSVMPKSSNCIVNGTSTTNVVMSREHQTPSSSVFDGSLLSRSVKTGKTNHVHVTDSISSLFANTSSFANDVLKTSMNKVVEQFKVSKLSKNCSPGVGSETAGRYSNKALFPYELFIKLYTWNKVELLPCGLTNCGNSCYANVVLQCLAFTQPLHAYFLQGFHSERCKNKDWCFTCEFESLILKVKEGNSPLSPSGILSQLQNNGSNLGNGRQEDAHEFLRYIIDQMQSICLKESSEHVVGSKIEETTLIGLTFGGYLRSKIKCMTCLGKSERHERIMDLTVEIEGDVGTLEEALKKFTSTELLDGENKYHCSRCKSYEKAKKKLKILEAPNVLTIALKRFQSGRFGKLNKSIEYPEVLDLAKYMSDTSDSSPIYKLYGVVVHLDTMNDSFSGHYVCYIKNNQNKWFKIDDSMVQPVELKQVKEKGAYMLLYSRFSPRAPRLLKKRIQHDAKIKVSGFPRAIPNIQTKHSSIPLNGPNPSSSAFIYSRHPMRKTDSSSDSSSLFSSCSDESSCRNSSDSDDTLSSCSPLYERHSPLANMDRYASSAPKKSGAQTDYPVFVPQARAPEKSNRPDGLEGKGSNLFLHSDVSKQCEKLSSSSSYRETDSERIGRIKLLDNLEVRACFRRSSFRR